MTPTLSTDHAAFRRAICADPDNDTPRLVYADWLDDQMPATEELYQKWPWCGRAEFIREQCGHHEFFDNYGMHEREDDFGPVIVDEPYGVWPDDCPSLTHRSVTNWYWHRGFISEVRISWEDWTHHRGDGRLNADLLLEWHPIRDVWLTTRPTLRWESYISGATIAWFPDGGNVFLPHGTPRSIHEHTIPVVDALTKRWPGPAEEPIRYHLPEQE